MTDLEITRLCAEASGIDISEQEGVFIQADELLGIYTGARYDPLRDDAQAMALMKRFNIFRSDIKNVHTFDFCDEDGTPFYFYSDVSLNHAICECIAKMQASKP